MQSNPYQQNPIQQGDIQVVVQQGPYPQNYTHQPMMQHAPYQNQPYPQQLVVQGDTYQQPMMSQGMPQVIQSKPMMGYPTECTGKYPEQFFCKHCQKTFVSKIETHWGAGSCLWCVMCSWSVIVALLPCCVDGLRDVYHYCPGCNSEVGKVAFMCD